ncbi:MAG: AAA family ATPase [Desulfomonile tiedjei]|uniref:AAA family ATPase n=1 Tax=Desulfomonile tiedjei TaxID=2358 RepID=A0A9D6UZZ7_9BACT|nr:AAA family ATPase [Desulfomonile tiedjei]
MKKSVETINELVESICGVLIGKEKEVKDVIVGLLARGHVLIEDIPGVGKTLLALATARSMGVRFRRIQFTSDTLPSDVIGVNVYDPKSSEFLFKEGPIFTEVLLADEINRTTPRTQSALLEAMAEGKVSVDGVTYSLSDPFFVLATMNPVERFGSFELPESQLDRFMLTVTLGYPDRDHERQILQKDIEHDRAEKLAPVTNPSGIRALQEKVRDVHIDASIMEYILDVIHATRHHPEIKLGLSSRGGLHLKRAMQALSLIEGRDYVIPSDLRKMFVPIALHRILLAGGAPDGRGRERKREILNQILQSATGPI